MGVSPLRDKLLEEVSLIPEENLADLYDVVRYFRKGIEASKGDAGRIMQLAGAWRDMPDEAFDSFLKDIAKRRRQAFSRRRSNETIAG
jgi:hypothetical protein